jgi:HPt (histidine-containing phosphotransfer) domain-containing protein
MNATQAWPLIDDATFEQLRRVMPAGEFSSLLALGMQLYRQYCDAMRDPQASLARIRSEAHKLKGSAGSVGLTRVSRLAAEFEACSDPSQVTPLVARLSMAIDESAAALRARGMPAESDQTALRV